MRHLPNGMLLYALLHFSCFSYINTPLSVKAINTSSTKAFFNEVETNKSSTATKSSEFFGVTEALKEIAYYLRAHKFNDYDRRYETDAKGARREYFGAFPRPPLRSLHWEVHRFCEPSFLSCVEYLNKRIRNTGLKRSDDTSVVIVEQHWNLQFHSQQVNATEEECRKMLKVDDRLANPFEGPIERFQWRVTASYYMCWYTMAGVPYLRHLSEACDNFASCLDSTYGPRNRDPRADDASDFKCAMYSFCPDPCCPIKHLALEESCWDAPENPCHHINPKGQRECSLNRTENTHFGGIVLNHWNITCACSQEGYRWSSRHGFCVDIDECVERKQLCKNETENCVNLPGGYRCACRWGYIWDAKTKECTPSAALSIIKLHRSKEDKEGESRKATSLVKRLLYLLHLRSSASRLHKQSINLRFLLFCFVSLLINNKVKNIVMH